MTNQGKKEDENENIWENEFDFRICHIKISLCVGFHESLRKNFWPIFKTFLANQGKIKDENEKIWENEFNF